MYKRASVFQEQQAIILFLLILFRFHPELGQVQIKSKDLEISLGFSLHSICQSCPSETSIFEILRNTGKYFQNILPPSSETEFAIFSFVSSSYSFFSFFLISACCHPCHFCLFSFIF